MRTSYLRDSSPGMQFLFSLLIFFAAWLIFQLLAVFTGMLFFNIGFREVTSVLSDYHNPVSISFQKYLQSVISAGMFIVAPFLIANAISDNAVKYLKLNHFPGYSIAILTALLMVFSLPMNNYFTYINGLLDLPRGFSAIQEFMENKEEQAQQVFERFLDVRGIWPLMINIIVIAVIPAIGEELFFRGVLQNIFIKWTRNVFLGVLITSFAFAVLHFQFLSVLPRFVLGMILGYIFVWTRSLWMPVIAHFVNNAFAVVYYYLMYNGKIGENIENVGKPDNDPVFGFLSMAIVIVILLVLRRNMLERSSRYQAVVSSED